MRASGIYKITNAVDGKFYIGSAKYIKERFSNHRNDLLKNKHKNSRLQNAYNKYGVESFVYDVVEVCNLDVLIEREQYYIDLLQPFYNILKTAGSSIGLLHTAETKAIIGKINKGRVPPNKGQARSNETKNLLKKAWVNRRVTHPITEDQRKVRSDNMKSIRKSNPPWNKGISYKKKSSVRINYTDEYRLRVSEASKLAWQKRKQITQ